ncbi:hypothetical protein [Amnibacterium kyonggiense]|uniref:Signal transduction histidine kinase n=1 Tax=Amnibacterium kyonggiense TaxID=595671 RepID=A0A4R7FH50_9MICO|nr:hypothetical protein [Amnibacterium kyonggiense]TDS75000.1 hypothetical protein CLV52_3524 [Amnibacterium kyonggiense]
MIVVPRWFSAGLASAIAAYTAAFAVIWIATARSPLTNLIALGFFGLAFGVSIVRIGRASLPATIVIVASGLLLPVLGSVGLDPVHDSYSSGAWYVSGVACLVVVLLWRRRASAAWILMGGLLVHTYAWGGFDALNGFGVVAATLIIAVMAAGGWAVARTEHHLSSFSEAEREALEWEAAQDAYHAERQVRLATTARLASSMLHRIAAAKDGLTDADRFECRVLEQTIRDEIRGRRLLNDAVREQVVAHRRRGALVQVNDDGGIDDIPAAVLEPMLAQIAAALEGLSSDRIIIRTAPRDSDTAVTVVAMSTDPVAAALGVDDDEEQVDLWLELERPVLA